MPRCTLAEKVQQRIDDALQMAGLDGWVMGEVPSARLFLPMPGRRARQWRDECVRARRDLGRVDGAVSGRSVGWGWGPQAQATASGACAHPHPAPHTRAQHERERPAGAVRTGAMQTSRWMGGPLQPGAVSLRAGGVPRPET